MRRKRLVLEEETETPEAFHMVRTEDESGVSGEGVVLEGARFHTGQVVVCWRSVKSKIASFEIFPSWEEFLTIHVSPHPGNHTKIVWL